MASSIRLAAQALGVGWPLLSFAAQALDIPDAGKAIQQLRQPPMLQKPSPAIQVEEPKPAATLPADETRITVRQLHITGHSRYSEAELLALTGFVPDSQVNLAELQQMTDKIQTHYRNDGYFLARAYLPAQDSLDGTLTIAVVEAQYGNIDLRNRSGLAEEVIQRSLRRIHSGGIITSGGLERSALLLSDMAGVGSVKPILSPGATTGTSDLIVEIEPGRKISGNLDFDVNGNRFTGANRLGGSVNFNNPSGHGDLFSLRAVSSFGGLNSGRAAYQMPLMDGQIGISYSATGYTLGSDLASIKAHGTADTSGLNGSYPFIRSHDLNLNGQLSYDDKKLQDRIDSTLTNTDKKAAVWTLGISGDRRDNLGGGGINTFGLSCTGGKLDIQTPAALVIDSTTARSQGSYAKLGYNAARMQSLNGMTSLYVSLTGQLASKNLDSSEKFSLGGAYGVRAYPQGEAAGDAGALLTLEVRRLLPQPVSLPGELQLTGFIDNGNVTLNRNPWVTGQNSRSLSGAGIGFNWSKKGDYAIKLELAWKLGTEKATADTDHGGRMWLQGVKYL